MTAKFFLFVLNWVNLAALTGMIFSFSKLSALKTAYSGAQWGFWSMLLCLVSTFVAYPPPVSLFLLISVVILVAGSLKLTSALPMTSLPQLMAFFHSLVGLAAVFIGLAYFLKITGENFIQENLILAEVGLGIFIGALTFTGSLVAFGKLQGYLNRSWGILQSRILLGILGLLSLGVFSFYVHSANMQSLLTLTFLGSFLGVIAVKPIGGADMPVVVSLLNACSGWAAVGIGFSLHSFLLVSVGSFVGASGSILSAVMCKGMNRSLWSVLFGNLQEQQIKKTASEKPVKHATAEDAAFFLEQAEKIIIVPGYGTAVARAQHALQEVASFLKEKGKDVRFAIHPVAGRMPGHMNVLLAEANIDSDLVQELDEINSDFSDADVVLVIGANDITNPSARTDKTSPLYGMPILDVDKAKTILFVKRSLAAGYSAVDNPLFYDEKTYMVLGDGKKVMENLGKSLSAT